MHERCLHGGCAYCGSVAPVFASDRTDTTGCTGGWQLCPFAEADQRGTDLFLALRDDVSRAWADGSVSTYTGPWNLFVQFYNERQPPCPLYQQQQWS